MDNRISYRIPEEDLREINESMNRINFLLAKFVLAMTPKQRQAKDKLGDASSLFVGKVIEYANSNPELVPPYLLLKEMEKDFDLVNQIKPILRGINQIQSVLADTKAHAGFETYKSGLAIYKTIGQAAKLNVPGAQTIKESLEFRFKGMGPKRKPKKQGLGDSPPNESA